MSSLSEPRRPRLLPSNRKLRHLKGLSLRNLTFLPTHTRTTDDALVPQPSHSKLEAVREDGLKLSHSRSSGNLRRDSLKDATGLGRPTRPRRTSLNLGGAHGNPGVRQKTLEEVVDGIVGDVFFSLHADDRDEPVYVSEVRERSTNFNFRFFDLAARDPTISRSPLLTIRIFARRPKTQSFIYLLSETIDLRTLNFIGTLLDRKYPPNALIFHLTDGVYSLDFPNRISEPRQSPAVPSASYNTLMKLANLESSIEDAIGVRDRIVGQINELLEQAPKNEQEERSQEVKLAEKYVSTQQRVNRQAEKRRDELRDSLKSRRAAIAKGREMQAHAEEDMSASREKLEENRKLVEETETKITGQRRRICADLSEVFPITPIPNAPPLSFQICNIPLPNSTYDAATSRKLDEDVLSAGLGLVSMLTRHLQFYLSHPLPYPLYPYGSRSHARDDISVLDRESPRRDFPLYLPRGGSTTGQWRFEYAWFLLNKDIESLCASQGLRVVDIRHTLPNLKYLLYVCSAGSEDVPERKKGGVRGLWLGRLKSRISLDTPDSVDAGSTNGSRRGSVDSEIMNQHGEVLRNAIIKGQGNGKATEPGNLPFGDGDAKFTLRTKGLRENVGS